MLSLSDVYNLMKAMIYIKKYYSTDKAEYQIVIK